MPASLPQSRPSKGRARHSAASSFTLIEILVVLAIVGVLISLLAPAVHSARRRADAVTSLSNLRQFGIALNLYREDRLHYPIAYLSGANHYQTDMTNYLRTTNFLANPLGAQWRLTPAYLCPSVRKKYKPTYPDHWGFAFNESVSRDVFFAMAPIYQQIAGTPGYRVVAADVLVPQPSRKIIMTCNANGNRFTYAPWDLSVQSGGIWDLVPPQGIHDGVDHYLYCDGHVEALRPSEDWDKINTDWFANVKTGPWQF